MVTAFDCAVLSEDVYNQEDNSLAEGHGWARLDGQGWGSGFAAGTYLKGRDRVVAFRGTDDFADVLSDARMVPDASVDRIEAVTPALLDQYGLSDREELVIGGSLLTQLLTTGDARRVIRTYANQVPPEQTRQAEAYLDNLAQPPTYFTGHSLGGALAKIMTVRRGIPCVALNSPYMGDLRGMTPVSSAGILSIRARSDPLSVATENAGNLPHGRVIIVDTPDYANPPPRRPEVQSYTRPTGCPRASGNWWTSEEGIYAAVAGPVCEAALDAWEPVGRALSAPRRHLRYWYRQYPNYIVELLSHVGAVALHFHSITPLRETMSGMGRFRRSLG
jgi:hypothetical protein